MATLGYSAMMNFKELFEAELQAYGIGWCQSCNRYNAHRRGFAVRSERVVHYDSKIATRASLHRGLHEIGHIVANILSMRRWEQEASAEAWATKRMRELGILVPLKVLRRGRAYVARMKRWGDNISASARRRGAT